MFSGKIQRTYVGCSKDVQDRLNRHNSGQVKATRNGYPWRLIYQEPVGSYSAARDKERYFKTGAGRRQIKKIIERWKGAGVADQARLESV